MERREEEICLGVLVDIRSEILLVFTCIAHMVLIVELTSVYLQAERSVKLPRSNQTLEGEEIPSRVPMWL